MINQQVMGMLQNNAGNPDMVRRIAEGYQLSQTEIAQALKIPEEAAARYMSAMGQPVQKPGGPAELTGAAANAASQAMQASGSAGGAPVKPGSLGNLPTVIDIDGGAPVKPGSLGNLPNQEGRSVASGADIMRGGNPGASIGLMPDGEMLDGVALPPGPAQFVKPSGVGQKPSGAPESSGMMGGPAATKPRGMGFGGQMNERISGLREQMRNAKPENLSDEEAFRSAFNRIRGARA